jgi:hypothetical protein
MGLRQLPSVFSDASRVYASNLDAVSIPGGIRDPGFAGLLGGFRHLIQPSVKRGPIMAFIRTIYVISVFIIPATAAAGSFIGLGDNGLVAGIGQPPSGTPDPTGPADGENSGLTVGVGSSTSVFALGTLTPSATMAPGGETSVSPDDGTTLGPPRSTESVVVEW